jgi:hypothetical protein
MSVDTAMSQILQNWAQGARLRRTNSEPLRSMMEEGRKRVLGIIAGILVARHLKTTEDLHESRPSPLTESPWRRRGSGPNRS